MGPHNFNFPKKQNNPILINASHSGLHSYNKENLRGVGGGGIMLIIM